MMTQEEMIKTFKSFPKPLKSSVLRKLMKDFEDDLIDESIENADKAGRELTVEERLAIVENLAGSIKMDDPPMTKKEVRDAYYEHLAEKYK
ncbi:MAG: hypothetical protein JSS77_00735 [Acidobacteria bacterium]|nr:hypothetical protein [Acidobacteriota bacterium]HMU33038.1 hypothetical protein [Pyrinomonadaceae bacterium]